MNKKIAVTSAIILMNFMTSLNAAPMRPSELELVNESRTRPLAIHFNSSGVNLIGSFLDESRGEFRASLYPRPGSDKGSAEIFIWSKARPADKCLFTATFTEEKTEVSMRKQGDATCWVNQGSGGYRLHVSFPRDQIFFNLISK